MRNPAPAPRSPLEADPRSPPLELKHAEHVVEPGTAGDPPPQLWPGHPGQSGQGATSQRTEASVQASRYRKQYSAKSAT